MGYPQKPEKSIILLKDKKEIHLDEEYGLLLVDVIELTPPEPKYYVVDIPNGDGEIDITEAIYGDVPYSNRVFKFNFLVIGFDNFEKTKQEISRLLHGKKYEYKLSWDDDYTYTGRFKIISYNSAWYAYPGNVGSFEVEVNTEPYKFSEPIVLRIDAVGGKMVYLDNGRKRVKPKVETKTELTIIHNGKVSTVTPGTWQIHDFTLNEGHNEVYFCSKPIYNLTWSDLKNNVTWSKFKLKRLFEWYKSNGDGTYVTLTWKDITDTWGEANNNSKKWSDYQYKFEDGNNTVYEDFYIEYRKGEL